MNIAIRVDASEKIGVGHLSRCQTLAERLVAKNCKVIFVCRDFGDTFLRRIRKSLFDVVVLPSPTTADTCAATSNPGSHGDWLATKWEEDAKQTSEALSNCENIDWLVVDHYGIDIRWQRVMRNLAKGIFVIDDLADRQMDCELFLDQSYCGTDRDRYTALLPTGCTRFIGPKNMLLGKEFGAAPKRTPHQPVKRILVSFGGTDPRGLSSEVIDRLHAFLPPNVKVDLAVGGGNQQADELRKYGERKNTSVHIDPANLANLIRSADLGIGCGGVTALERAAMLLPSLAIAAADNQQESLQHMERLGLARLITSPHEIETNVNEMLRFGTFPVPRLVIDGTDRIVSTLLSCNSKAMPQGA